MKVKGVKEKLIFFTVFLISAIAIQCTSFIGTGKYYPVDSNQSMQIVFLGDSNFAFERNGKTIPIRVSEKLGANIYNCSVGGTTAVKLNLDNSFDSRLDRFSLYNIVKVIKASDHEALTDFYGDKVPREVDAIRKFEMLVNVDMTRVDYVVISYGLNDYMIAWPAKGEDAYDVGTYAGALRTAIESIQSMSPNTKIIISSITYCYFQQDNGELQDGYEYSWGAGTIEQYRDAAKEVCADYENVYFVDNLEQLDIDKENCRYYIDDGIHFSEAGQELYADNLVSVIKKIESGLYD